MRAVVVLPTYNEALNIAAMLDRLLASPAGIDVLVVDDSSPDGTAALVTGHAGAADGRVHLLSRPGKGGLGAAYRAGFRRAVDGGYQAVVQMDADGSHPVDALPRMLERLRAGDDLVIGSRYVPGGATVNWPLRRRLLSRGGNRYARAMLHLPVRDLTGGYKAWRAGTLAGVLDGGGAAGSGYVFQIQTTLAAHVRGARISEVPIEFADRVHGESKMSTGIAREAVVAVARMRWRPVTPAAATPVPLPAPRRAPDARADRHATRS